MKLRLLLMQAAIVLEVSGSEKIPYSTSEFSATSKFRASRRERLIHLKLFLTSL